MRLILKLAVLLGLTVGLAACATQSFSTSDTLRRDGRPPRILMMPPDVELTELDAAGAKELNAQWTTQATGYIAESVRARLSAMKAQFVEYKEPADDTPEAEQLYQLQKLNGAVATTIGLFHYDTANRLPAKNGRFDWSLGPAAQALGSHADADYALFVTVRDSYSSPARFAMRMLAASLGMPIEGGRQMGHASLVDLRTGQVVWVNALHSRRGGDLRNRSSADETVALLLNNLPK